MKERYTPAEIEILAFKGCDILTLSAGSGEETGPIGGGPIGGGGMDDNGWT